MTTILDTRDPLASLWQAAALGMNGVVDALLAGESPPDVAEIHSAFWAACHGGQLATAQRLYAAGANVNWVAPWDATTSLDAARRSGAFDVLTWLHSNRARSAEQLAGCD